MRVLQAGHVYELGHIDGPGKTVVSFVNKEPGFEREGVTTQEICRMELDRTRYCNNCMPHRVNEEIIYHFRKIIALHEARAIERATDKGEIVPEDVELGHNGHWRLPHRPPPLADRQLGEDRPHETRELLPTTMWSSPEQRPSYSKEEV